MTRTYSEQRQAAYFAAARKLYALAAEVANDVLADPIVTADNARWAGSILESTDRKARDLEALGHAEAIASTRQENVLSQYRASVERARRRLRLYAAAGFTAGDDD